jgi:hypothetical protein
MKDETSGGVDRRGKAPREAHRVAGHPVFGVVHLSHVGPSPIGGEERAPHALLGGCAVAKKKAAKKKVAKKKVAKKAKKAKKATRKKKAR